SHLGKWLCTSAEVEPKMGGKFDLQFDQEPRFHSRGRVTRMTADVDLGFSWMGPPTFGAMLNEPEPQTEVYVRLMESPEGIDVTLEHSGWKSGEEWEDARSWHFHFWDERLHGFKDYMIRAAYG
ncbi:MAG TPA: SRPBCC domain-containing protein, partial [Thermoplasmata archaeon]